jgi:putative Ca2+/H+ antiporter (TMEM165/GDT1 family)
MNLTEEEYKNIWLRVKENLENWINKRLIFWFGVLSILTSFGIHIYIGSYLDKALDEKVIKILNSKDFSEKLISSTLDKLENVKNQEKSLNTKFNLLENKIEEFNNIASNFPFIINKDRITFISKNNILFTLEKGDCTNLSKITFSQKFSSTPTVIISNCTNLISTKKTINLQAVDITNKGFTVYSSYPLARYSWIAVGN